MKKILTILSFLLSTFLPAIAQDEPEANERIREKMNEFIQKRLQLTKDEAERFNPIFLRYFREWRTTNQQYRADKQMKQLKIAELRLRYRTEFREVVGERRSSQVYDHQDRFIKELETAIRDRRLKQKDRINKKNRALLE